MPATPSPLSLVSADSDRELSVAEDLAHRLRLRILDGEFVAGQRLVETDLIAEFGVGRSAVREALKHLEATGLVDIRRQKGASVVRFTREKLVQLFQIRERLEGLGCYLAAQVSDAPENQAWLKSQLDIWADTALVLSEREHMTRNVELHEGLVLMSGNQYLKEALDRLQIPAYRQRFVKVIDDDARRKSAAEHIEIVEAVLSGDAERSENLMRQHVRETAKLAVSVAEPN